MLISVFKNEVYEWVFRRFFDGQSIHLDSFLFTVPNCQLSSSSIVDSSLLYNHHQSDACGIRKHSLETNTPMHFRRDRF